MEISVSLATPLCWLASSYLCVWFSVHATDNCKHSGSDRHADGINPAVYLTACVLLEIYIQNITFSMRSYRGWVMHWDTGSARTEWPALNMAPESCVDPISVKYSLPIQLFFDAHQLLGKISVYLDAKSPTMFTSQSLTFTPVQCWAYWWFLKEFRLKQLPVI